VNNVASSGSEHISGEDVSAENDRNIVMNSKLCAWEHCIGGHGGEGDNCSFLVIETKLLPLDW
jgi:hypothetical protein